MKGKSTYFSFLPCILDRSNNNLTFSLPDNSSYLIPCSVHPSSLAHVVTKLFVRIRFTINSIQQLICLASDLYEEVVGEFKFLTCTDESKNSHLPIFTSEKTWRTKVFVRTDLTNKKHRKLRVQVLFSMWKVMKLKEKEGYGLEHKLDDIFESIKKEGVKASADMMLQVANEYVGIFKTSDRMIVLNSPTHSYWSQLLLLSPDITPVTDLYHLPISPLNLRINEKHNKVVLRDLQGMLIPYDRNVVDITFRFSNSSSGFLMKLYIRSYTRKLKVPAAGMVAPVTLVMYMNKSKLVGVACLGSWKQFNANFPDTEGYDCLPTYSDENMELLLDDNPPAILSSFIEEDDIVTLEE